MIVRFPFNTCSSGFIVCTERARIYFNMSSYRERKRSFENILGENSESSTRSKKRLSHQRIV